MSTYHRSGRRQDARDRRPSDAHRHHHHHHHGRRHDRHHHDGAIVQAATQQQPNNQAGRVSRPPDPRREPARPPQPPQPAQPTGPQVVHDSGVDFHQPDSNRNLTAAEHSASDASETDGDDSAACLVCTRVARRRAALRCGHTWCRRCLRTQVRNALRGGDGSWPPRCCAGEGGDGEGEGDGEIGEGVVEWLGDRGVWDMYRLRRAEMEVAVGERVYCHLITCASFIPPVHHSVVGDGSRGGRTALCQQPGCGRHTCVDCGTQAHLGRDCPRDPDMEAVLQTIEAHGYQFCARCNVVVERIDGCNHITCRCGYQFCYMCGTRWRECDCPNYGGVRRQRADRPQLEERAVQDQGAAPERRDRRRHEWEEWDEAEARVAEQMRLWRLEEQEQEQVAAERGRRDEFDHAAGARVAEQMRLWRLEEQEAARTRAALDDLAPDPDEELLRWVQEDSEARAQAEQMRLWAEEDAEARRLAGQQRIPVPLPAPAPARARDQAPARAPAVPRNARGVRGERPERPSDDGWATRGRGLPVPVLVPPGVGMRGPEEDHMYRPDPARERQLRERQLRERARHESAQRMRAQQLGPYGHMHDLLPPPFLDEVLGLMGGEWIVPQVLEPGRYRRRFGGQDMGYYPPGIDMRMMMLEQFMGGHMGRHYEYRF